MEEKDVGGKSRVERGKGIPVCFVKAPASGGWEVGYRMLKKELGSDH